MRTLLALAFLALPLAPSVAIAQCATWAEGYGPGGVNGPVHVLEMLDIDGSGPELYAGGSFDLANGEPCGVARWNGEQWEPFGAWSLFRTVNALTMFDAGNGPRLYAAGYNGVATLPFDSLAVWDGTSWSVVPNSPVGEVRCMAVFGGALYMGGLFIQAGGVVVNGLALWNGSSWAGLGGAQNAVNDLVVHDDGSGPALYAAGDFEWIGGGLPYRGIARWSGSAWSPVGTQTTNVRALGIHDFGSGPNLVVGGAFTSFGGAAALHAARWDGSSWSAVPGFSTTSPTPLGVREFLSVGSGPSAEFYAAGDFDVTGSVVGRTGVARWNGSAWTDIGTGIPGVVESLARFDDGSGTQLFAGGAITSVNGLQTRNVARFDGVAWRPAGDTGGVVLAMISGEEGINASAWFDDGSGAALYVGGKLIGAGSLHGNVIARHDGVTWSSLGTVTGTVNALEVFDDGSGTKLYAGGAFTAIDGVSFPGIARFNGTAWEELPTAGGLVPLASTGVRSLRVHDDGSGPALFVGGQIHLPGVSAFVARWRASGWSTIGAQSQTCSGSTGVGAGLAIHDDGSGSALYVLGYDLQFDCVESNGIAKWDGTTWTSLGAGLQNFFRPGAGLAGASYDDGTGPALYVGGEFTVGTGSAITRNIARWKNGEWTPLGLGMQGWVTSLAVFDDGTGVGPALYVGGYMYLVDGLPRDALARWHDGAWSSANGFGDQLPNQIGHVNTILPCTRAGGRSLFVGGLFLNTGTIGAGHIARLDACAETGKTTCYGDGTGTACPCGNTSASSDRAGCLNSLGTGGTLRARGEPSIGSDTLVLDGSLMSNASVLYFQGTQQVASGAGSVFGAGLRCAGGTTMRIGTKNNVGGASSYPLVGDASISVRGNVVAPGTRWYQARYRNAFPLCVPEVFNLTNAVQITWSP